MQCASCRAAQIHISLSILQSCLLVCMTFNPLCAGMPRRAKRSAHELPYQACKLSPCARASVSVKCAFTLRTSHACPSWNFRQRCACVCLAATASAGGRLSACLTY
eukprot:6490416-Amphidinium_carterae.4